MRYLGGFFKYSWEITSGYTEAMSTRGRPSELVWYCATASLLLAVVCAVEVRLRRWQGILPATVIALALFLGFKHAFVRQDRGHVWPEMVSLTSLVLLLSPFAWLRLKQGRQKWLVVAACIVAFLNCADWPGLPEAKREMGPSILGYLGRAPRLAVESLSGFVQIVLHPSDIDRVHAASMAQIRGEWPLPAMAGTVDMYPPNQAVIFAYGLSYRPRPVFQSCSAYTAALENLNRRYVAGPGSPENILFGIAPIDWRFPALEDGLSWPELLTRYAPAGSTPQFLILKKRRVPLEYALEPLSEYQVGWDQTVTLQLPSDDPIWAEIDVRPTLEGRLMTIVYKPDLMVLALQTKDGHIHVCHLIPGMARCGFLLSPVIRTRQQFGLLYSDAGLGQFQGQTVAKIMLIGVGKHRHPQGYEDQFTLRLYRLKYPRQ